MKTRLEHHQGKKKKFWQITINENVRTITQGSMTAKKAPLPKEKAFKSQDKAIENYEREMAKKIAAGFFDPTSLSSLLDQHKQNDDIAQDEIDTLKKQLPYLSEMYLDLYRTGIFNIWDSQFGEKGPDIPGLFGDLVYLFAASSAANIIKIDALDPYFYIAGQFGDGSSLVIINQGKWKNKVGWIENPDGMEEHIIPDDIDASLQGWIDKQWLHIGDENYDDFVLKVALHRKATAYDKLIATREATIALENKIGSDPAAIETLTLEELGLRTLPDVLEKCVNLRELSLRKNSLTEIPEVIRHLKKLEHLDLYYNEIEEVPEWIGELPLKSLNLGINHYSVFPTHITSISTLERLTLDTIDSLPAELCQLTNLTHFSVSNVKGPIVENGLGRCTALIDLNLGHVTHLCDDIGNLVNLEKLIAMFEHTSEPAPKSISDLANLKDLSIGSAKLPENIGKLRSLKRLRFSGEEIPDSLTEMISLERLDLHYCKATALPSKIGDLKNLEWLSLQSTMINALPDSLKNLKKLKYADLRSKPQPYLNFDKFRDALPDVEVKSH